jgi:DNA-binding FadR family transcriptional regulator
MENDQTDISRLRAYCQEQAGNGPSRLPPEPKLAELMDVSRGRLRTLLKTLEQEGLIWRQVGKGTFVGPRGIDPMAPKWAQGISLNDIMQARLLLEPQLAAQAAIHARPADVMALERTLEEMSAVTSYAAWKVLDDRLHRQIAEATHNALLLLLIETLRTPGKKALDVRLNEVFGKHATPLDTDSQHRAIIAAIRDGAPERAEKEMRNHIELVRDRLFDLR